MIWRAANATTLMPVANLYGSDWEVVAGDFDGNRKVDLVWRNTTTGKNRQWRAAQYNVQRPISDVADTAWHIVH